MVSSHYKEHKVYISTNQKKKLKAALKTKKSKLSVKVQAATVKDVDSRGENALLLLTKRQITRVEKSKRGYTKISMSRRQLHANKTFEGGFISMLAGLALRALPHILTGLATGALKGLANKYMSNKASETSGDGVFVQKGNHCYQAHPVEGNGLFLSPRGRRLAIAGDGLFLKHGNNIQDGKGLILGKNSPFKNIPILGWVL